MTTTTNGILYYAHSIKKYDTAKEKSELATIRKIFPKAIIYNPNNSRIKNSSSPMEECYRIIKRKSTVGVIFSTYLNHIGRGVYEEIQLALRLNKFIGMIKNIKIIPFTKMVCQIKDETDWAVRYAVIKPQTTKSTERR